MFITFIGPPISGKTTAAASLFANLKEKGFGGIEFLTEHARMYIARKKRSEGAAFTGLDDIDQNLIMLGQESMESDMSYNKDTILISDSSAVLAMLYMTDRFLEFQAGLLNTERNVINVSRIAAARYDIIFRCSPVRPGALSDPNRIHSFEQSVELDKRIDKVLDLAEVDRKKVVHLTGSIKERVRDASFHVLENWVKHLASKVG